MLGMSASAADDRAEKFVHPSVNSQVDHAVHGNLVGKTPDDDFLLMPMATCLQKLGKNDETVATCRKRLKYQPKNAGVQLMLGTVLMNGET